MVILVGFMGAGKTSVGHALARHLHCRFEDLDERVASRAGRSIEQVFLDSGEAEFRRIETSTLRDLARELGSSLAVLAVGGGAFVQEANLDLLNQSGARVVFLDAPVEELWRRCEKQDLARPLRQDRADFERLYRARRPGYLKAQWTISTEAKSIEDVAMEVAQTLGLKALGADASLKE